MTFSVWDFELCYRPAEAIDAICRLYEQFLDPTEPIHIGFEIDAVQDARLSSGGNADDLLDYDYQSKADKLVYSKTLPLAEWKAGLFEHVADIYEHFAQRFNYIDASRNYARNQVDRLFKKQIG